MAGTDAAVADAPNFADRSISERSALTHPSREARLTQALGKAALGCALAACLFSPVLAKPVNYQKDLVGRKICWYTSDLPSYCGNACVNSSTTTYLPGNKYYNTYWGNGSFVGQQNTTDKGVFESVLELSADGTFRNTVRQPGHTIVYTGKYCD
jgi:hypothetical protein